MRKTCSVFGFLFLAALAILQPRYGKAADGPITYFSEEAPLEVPRSELLSSTDQVILAKVRVLGRPASLVGVDQSGLPSRDGPHER